MVAVRKGFGGIHPSTRARTGPTESDREAEEKAKRVNLRAIVEREKKYERVKKRQVVTLPKTPWDDEKEEGEER